MKEITLTQNQIMIIDDEDFDLVSKYKWHIWWSPNTKSYYVQTTIKKQDGKRTSLKLHRLLMGLDFGDKRQVDHINHDTLDNRRSNLRVVTASQNKMNSGKQRNNTSGFKGVSFNKASNKWGAQIRYLGKYRYLGRFDTKEQACQAYVEACKKYHAEFANY